MRHKLLTSISLFIALLFVNKVNTYCFEKMSFASLFSSEDYFSNRRINDLLYDSRGFLWLGSLDGLLRYDGSVFKSFNRMDLNTESSAISCLFEDSKGNVWIGTEAGLCKYDLSTGIFVCIDTSDSEEIKIDTKVGCIREDHNGLIWFSLKSKGLWSFNPETSEFKHYFYEIGIPGASVPKINSFIIDGNGTFFISLYCQGMMICRDEFRSIEYLSVQGFDFSDDNFSQIIMDKMNRLFVSSVKYGFCELFPYASKAEVLLSFPSDVHSTGVCIDSSENILLSTTKGMYILNTRTLETTLYTLDNTSGLYSDSFSCVLSDDNAGIIAGLSSGGMYYSTQSFGLFSRYDRLSDGTSLAYSEVKCFSEDSNGDIWILSKTEGILKLDKRNNTLKKKVFWGVPDKCSYLFCSGDTLWLSSGASVFTIDLKSGRVNEFSSVFLDANSLIDRSVFPIVSTETGILFGTALGIITYNETTRTFDHLPGLEECNVSSVFQDGDTLLVSTFAHGLVFYDLSCAQQIHPSYENELASITGHRVYGALKDDSGRIWIGTSESGIVVVSPKGEIRVLNTETTFGSFSSNNIKYIQIDRSGTVWATTENGLISISSDLSNLEHYSEIDGLLNDSFLLFSGFISSDGTLYFGNRDGFISFHSDHITRPRVKTPNLYIDELRVNNELLHPSIRGEIQENIDKAERVSLNYDRNSLIFHFSRPILPSSSGGYVICKMDGLDKEWVRLDQNNEFICREMPPGRYKLLAKSYSNKGELEVEHAALEIRIRPPFYKSVPAIVAYILVLLAFLVVFCVKFIKKMKREEEERYRKFTEEQLAMTPEREMLRAAQLGKSPSTCLRDDLSDTERAFVAKLEMVIDKHMSDDKLSYTMIAEHLCIGKQTLNLKMKNMLGITVNNYIMLFRLFAAVSLLSEDDSRVNVVCYKVGFNTPSYFAKCFKNAFGMLPGEFKEM